MTHIHEEMAYSESPVQILSGSPSFSWILLPFSVIWEIVVTSGKLLHDPSLTIDRDS